MTDKDHDAHAAGDEAGLEQKPDKPFVQKATQAPSAEDEAQLAQVLGDDPETAADATTTLPQQDPAADFGCIAMVETGGLSDVVQSSVVAQSIRLAWPEARILLVCGPVPAKIAKGLGFDDAVVFDKDGAHQGLTGIDTVAKRLRKQKVKALLLGQRSKRNALLAWRSKIFMRVAWQGSVDLPLSGMLEGWAFTHQLHPSTEVTAHSDQLLQLLQPLQIEPASRFPRFRPSVKAKTYVTDFLAARKIDKNQLIALIPGTHWPSRSWPVAHWAQLIDQLQQRDLAPVLIVGPADGQLIEDIRRHRGAGRNTHHAQGSSLEQAAELMRRAPLSVGVDTGLAHLGLAAGGKSLLLFGPSDPARYVLMGRAKSLRVDVDCRPCVVAEGSPCPLPTQPCMAGISPDKVLSKALKMLRR